MAEKIDVNELMVISARGKSKVYHRSSDEEFRRRWAACGAVENGTRWTRGYLEENGLKPCSKCFP